MTSNRRGTGRAWALLQEESFPSDTFAYYTWVVISVAASLIKNPVAHCWSEPFHHKRKFCNVCRKRLDDSESIHCERECHVPPGEAACLRPSPTSLARGKPAEQLQMCPDVQENLLDYGMSVGVSLRVVWDDGTIGIQGHLRYQSSEGAYLGDNDLAVVYIYLSYVQIINILPGRIFSNLSKCHAACHVNINSECTFGMLEPIYLPPHAVSIPRTEVPMEAIIGVQVRRKDTLSRCRMVVRWWSMGDLNPKIRVHRDLPKPSEGDPKPALSRPSGEPCVRKLRFPVGHLRWVNTEGNACPRSASDQWGYSSDEGLKGLEIKSLTYSIYARNLFRIGSAKTANNVLTCSAPTITNSCLAFPRSCYLQSRNSNVQFIVMKPVRTKEPQTEMILSWPPTGPILSTLRGCGMKSLHPPGTIGNQDLLRSQSAEGVYSDDNDLRGVLSPSRCLGFIPRSHLLYYVVPANLFTARSTSEEFSSGDAGRYRECEEYPQTHTPSGRESRQDKQDKQNKNQEERDEEVIKVYDGNNSLRRRIFRTIVVSRQAPLKQVLTQALRAFHITKDPNSFHLTDLYSPDEAVLQDPTPVLSLHRKEGKRPAVFLRFKKRVKVVFKIVELVVAVVETLEHIYSKVIVIKQKWHMCMPGPTICCKQKKRFWILLRMILQRVLEKLHVRDRDNDKGEVRVYPGKLQVSQALCTVPVDSNTTVGDLIREALKRFGLEDYNCEDYRCSEVLLDRGVTERVLSWNERPWEIVKQLGKDSVRQMELMRFYLQLKQDPHGPNIALFVGNLPPNLSERNYEKYSHRFFGKRFLFDEKISDKNKFSNIGPIYYEYGSMVITYEDSEKAVRALYILRESKYEDKQPLLGLLMLLPNIEPSMIPHGVQPLLVFVNVKSGGCQGLELISSFRKLLNPYQVFDLDNGGPLPGLYVFRNIQNYKILVCGGDGTIGWVLQCLDNVGQDSQCSSPACAIVPLGTGNDLARVLRWGPGYTGGEDPLNLLRDVIDAEEIRLDRWTVVFHPEDKPDDSVKQVNSTGKKRQKLSKMKVTNEQIRKAGSTSEDNSQIFVMNNYFGIGIDADLCLDFHNAREENPGKFISRLHNKSVYVKMGLLKMVGPKMCKDLHRKSVVGVQERILGVRRRDDQFSKPNHWDGMLEVVGVTGVVHLGQIQSGLRTAMRIAQGGHIKIHLNSDIPVQVDGEPWVQSPCDVVVLKSALKATMLKKMKGKMKRRNTEPSMLVSPGAQLAPLPSNDGESPTDPNNTTF
ncbi:hypothetical protein NQ317_016560 [Molorchus minor]|uniref:Diacylglycerol kinase n=1 Tax=Molorchus minor TaxID=1323400 RepID=A0ABQ9J1M7_9CUCU|nr:hypothetical protein NQ317_016560 [Molorchus minor]